MQGRPVAQDLFFFGGGGNAAPWKVNLFIRKTEPFGPYPHPLAKALFLPHLVDTSMEGEKAQCLHATLHTNIMTGLAAYIYTIYWGSLIVSIIVNQASEQNDIMFTFCIDIIYNKELLRTLLKRKLGGWALNLYPKVIKQ